MIKYIKNSSSNLIKFNTETTNAEALSNISSNIDWIWVLDEDGEFEGNEVNAGDILIRFYPTALNPKEKEYILVKDGALKNYYQKLLKYKKEVSNESVFGENSCCEAVTNETV